MGKSPSTNGPNGRDARGRFVRGNQGGPGNPHARKVAQLRSALLKAVKLTDLRAIVKALVSQAKQGDVAAAKLLLERLLGPPIAVDIEDRLELLEEFLKGKEKEKENRLWAGRVG